ncbi:MAG: MlaD family protein [Marmoricola sp.]
MSLLRSLRSPFGIGIAAVVLFAGSVVFGLNATHGMPLVPRKEVRVAFTDLSGLDVGDDVRTAGARVGYVADLSLVNGQPVATLKLDNPNTKLYEDAIAARVTDRSSLGQKFVELDPGTPKTGPLRGNGIIPASQTVKSEDIGQLFDSFDPRTRAATSNFLTQFGGGLIGHGPGLHALAKNGAQILKDTSTVSGAIANENGAPLESMLASADQLSSRLKTRQADLAKLIDQFAGTVKGFNVDDGSQVDQTLAKAPGALTSINAALAAINTPLSDTAAAMSTLRPGASALGQATPDLRGFLRDATSPLQKVPGVSQVAIPGVGSLTTVVSDARPLSLQLIKTGAKAAPLAGVLGSYAWDIANFYTDAQGALARGDSAGNWLRILLLPGAESIATPIPTVPRDPYQPPKHGGS